MSNSIVAVLLMSLVSESTIDYTIEQHGPHTIYDGMVKLYSTEESKFPCLDYTFDIPDGDLTGGSISSNPGKPMIPFDWERIDNTINIFWCRTQLPLHPFTGEDMQSYPIWTPRRFEFRVTKTKFDGEDLGALLGDWGPPELVCPGYPTPCYTLVSPWDLNHDTNVDGADLLIILANWKVD